LIPFYLTVESDDQEALALLAKPNAPDVTIYHRVQSTLPGVENVGGSLILPGDETNRPLSKVVWSNIDTSPSRIVLYGEMKLPETLRPGFAFGDLEVKYFVESYAPSISEFKPKSSHKLFQTEVQICSVHYGEPRPRSYLK